MQNCASLSLFLSEKFYPASRFVSRYRTSAAMQKYAHRFTVGISMPLPSGASASRKCSPARRRRATRARSRALKYFHLLGEKYTIRVRTRRKFFYRLLFEQRLFFSFFLSIFFCLLVARPSRSFPSRGASPQLCIPSTITRLIMRYAIQRNREGRKKGNTEREREKGEELIRTYTHIYALIRDIHVYVYMNTPINKQMRRCREYAQRKRSSRNAAPVATRDASPAKIRDILAQQRCAYVHAYIRTR